MPIHIYGIKNCDTMKKVFAWLSDNNIDYTFHDYKKSGADVDILKRAIDAHGWENVINRKGMTWRKLPEETKAIMCESSAIETAKNNPSIIKRPMTVANDGQILLGFTPDTYQKTFL